MKSNQTDINQNQTKYVTKRKNCSYLAVVAGLCGEADYIFIPEDPPNSNWPEALCQQLSQARLHYFIFYFKTKILIFTLNKIQFILEKEWNGMGLTLFASTIYFIFIFLNISHFLICNEIHFICAYCILHTAAHMQQHTKHDNFFPFSWMEIIIIIIIIITCDVQKLSTAKLYAVWWWMFISECEMWGYAKFILVDSCSILFVYLVICRLLY